MLKIGDYVSLTYVDEQDIIHRRYVGEVGVFQGNSDDDYAKVRFPDWSEYLVNESSLNLCRTATAESILYAYCCENDLDLLNRLNEFMNEKR